MISIIIPTYNREAIIGYTLDSLNADNHPGVELEVIVIDDGSTDNVLDLIRRKYPDVLLANNKGKGAPTARNTGLAMARGEYVVYLDSDDLIGPGFLKKKIETLRDNNHIDACYGEYDFFESDGAFDVKYIAKKHKYPLLESEQELEQHLVNNLKGNFIPPNAIVWKTAFLRKIGGHDTALLVNQDVELLVRALFNGLQLKGIKDGTKVYIRSHSLDSRVGSAGNSIPKLQVILALRKQMYADLVKYKLDTPACLKALSTYLFNFWKSTRHFDKAIAGEFLQLSKEVYWPVEIKGNIVYRTLSKLVGPVKAVELKYFLLKRD